LMEKPVGPSLPAGFAASGRRIAARDAVGAGNASRALDGGVSHRRLKRTKARDGFVGV